MRVDLHTHTILSDGELLPIELARRAFVKGHKAIAFTDHASLSTMDRVIDEARRDAELAEVWGIQCLTGVEITHVPASKIDMVVARARKLGAEIIVIHGETISEPVEKGTNLASVKNPEIDILAHPGFITEEEVQLAKDNGVYLEITSRASHCKTNGHVAALAKEDRCEDGRQLRHARAGRPHRPVHRPHHSAGGRPHQAGGGGRGAGPPVRDNQAEAQLDARP